MEQGGLVDGCAARDVDEKAIGTKRVEHVGADDARCRRAAGERDDEKVRPAGQRHEIGFEDPIQCFAAIAGKIANLAIEASRAFCDGFADPAHARDADLAAEETRRERHVALRPIARSHMGVTRRDLPRDGERQGNADIGDVAGQDVGRVGDMDAVGVRMSEIDGIRAHAVAGDDLQIG